MMGGERKSRPQRVIAGSSRSGTTWVLDSIAEANGLRPIFEPLHPDAVHKAIDFADHYVRDTANEAELASFMEEIFAGKVSCLWTKYRKLPERIRPTLKNMTSWDYNYSLMHDYKMLLFRYLHYRQKKKLPPIVKFIRANLMLGWLAKNFDAKIIFLVRHPGAVAISKMKRNSPEWDFFGPFQQRIFRQYQNNQDLMDDYLSKYTEVFSWKLSAIAGHTVLWCIENILPIYKAQESGRAVFFYEDLVQDPMKCFQKIATELELARVPSITEIIRPSQQAATEMENKPFDKRQVDKWMSIVSKDQLDEIDNILTFFNVTTYNAYNPLPIQRQQDRL